MFVRIKDEWIYVYKNAKLVQAARLILTSAALLTTAMSAIHGLAWLAACAGFLSGVMLLLLVFQHTIGTAGDEWMLSIKKASITALIALTLLATLLYIVVH